MVSSACRGSCATMPSKSNTRILNIDRRKDYTLPLLVETSVEYDLPSHIYPPKGSEPILMIHPAFTTPVRARRVSVTSHSPVVLTNTSSVKPLSALPIQNNQQEVKNTTKSSQPIRIWCSCGNPSCNSSVSNSTRVVSVRNPTQQMSVLTSRPVSQIPENIIYSAVKNIQQSTEVKSPQTHKQLQQKTQILQQKMQLQQQNSQIQHNQQNSQIQHNQQIQQQNAQIQQQNAQLQQQKAQLQQQKAQLQQQQKAQIQQQNAQLHKQLQQVHQQKQLQLQQQQHLQQVQIQQVQIQQQFQERAKLQAQQLQQLQQAQKQKAQQTTNTLPRQQTTTDQLMAWSSGGRCQGPCCQPRLGNLVPSQVEFLAPGLPPSLLTRTPTRGPSGGSPKLRARTRRGLSVANTVNLPEYLGSARSSRTSSVGGIVGGSSHVRTRSSSMLAATPAPITAHQVASALDVVRAHALTPRTLLASSQQLHSTISNTPTLLSTVGQSRDSGCSLSAEGNISINYINNENSLNSKPVEWTWNVVDSGFCTPVDNCEDQIMEPFDMNILGTYTPVAQPSTHANNTPTSYKETTRTTNNLSWMRDFAAPLTSSSIGSLPSSFIPPANPHYIPQPIWNLAY